MLGHMQTLPVHCNIEYFSCVQVPCGGDCVLRVEGLQPNEEYVFAVAAYTSSGEMVGRAIGQTGRPILASSRLPLLAAWGYCCQVGQTVIHPMVVASVIQLYFIVSTVCLHGWVLCSGKEDKLFVVETLYYRRSRQGRRRRAATIV